MEIEAGSRADLAPPGSPDYFALLFASPPLRADWRALLKLEKRLEDLSHQPMEREVRNAKLGWWAGELERLTQGKAVHPAAMDAYAVLQSHGLDPQPFLVLFAAVVREAGDELPNSPEQLLEHAANRSAVIPLLAARLLNECPDSEVPGTFTQLGRARFLVTKLAAGHICHGETPLQAGAPETPTGTMLAELARRLRASLAGELEALPVTARGTCTPLLVMAGEIKVRLDRLARGSPTQKGSQIESLWRAWRNARRASRGKLPR